MSKKLSDFEQAFAGARAKGDREFSHRGKKYHTRRADETPAQYEAKMAKSKPAIKPYRSIEIQAEELPPKGDVYVNGVRVGMSGRVRYK
jgi:hypothetical protein